MAEVGGDAAIFFVRRCGRAKDTTIAPAGLWPQQRLASWGPLITPVTCRITCNRMPRTCSSVQSETTSHQTVTLRTWRRHRTFIQSFHNTGQPNTHTIWDNTFTFIFQHLIFDLFLKTPITLFNKPLVHFWADMNQLFEDFAKAHAKQNGYLLAQTLSPVPLADSPNRLLAIVQGSNSYSLKGDVKHFIDLHTSTKGRRQSVDKHELKGWVDVYVSYWKALQEILAVDSRRVR